MTLEKLAKITQNGFVALEKKIDRKTDKKLEKLKKKLDKGMDKKLEKLETRMDKKLEKLETRMDKKLEKLETRMDKKLEGLAAMTQRGFVEMELKNDIKLDKLEARMNKKLDDKFNKVLIGQDRILKQLEILTTEQAMDKAVHRRQDKKIEDHEKRIDDHGARIVKIEKKLDTAYIK